MTRDFGMRITLFEECALYTGHGKEKAPRAGEVARGAKKRTPGKSCSQSFVRCAWALPRNLHGGDRRQLRSGQSSIDGREHHAATATTLDQHSRHRRPHARDALRVGKNQRYCGSRHHGVGQSNRRATTAAPMKSMSYASAPGMGRQEGDVPRHLVTRFMRTRRGKPLSSSRVDGC